MAPWADALTATPDLAARVQARFDMHGLGFLATVRRDGSPRISGIEPLFALDGLWLGMMPDSRKLADLRRDPRLALHSASVDKDVRLGDAKITGRAVPVDDPVRFDRFLEAFRTATGRAPDEPFPLFTVDVDEIVMTAPANDRLVVEWWTPAGGTRLVERT